MRLYVILLSVCLVTACQHYDPADMFSQEKFLNIAVINSETYGLISGAHCKISIDTSTEILETTKNPDAILIDTNYHSLMMDCEAPGYTQKALAVTNRINHWSAADLFILPSDIVDVPTDILPYYPSHVLALMSKTPFTTPEETERQHQLVTAKEPIFQGVPITTGEPSQ